MTTKNLMGMAAAAVILGGVAYGLNCGSKGSAPKLNGKAIAPGLKLAEVAKIELGSKLVLAAGDAGWTLETLYGYPADRAKIAENLLKLSELKVGQVVRGKQLAETMPVVLRDAVGKELLQLPLGEKHAKWGHGRYAKVSGETVLVADTLDAFDGDAKSWCDTRIASIPSAEVTAASFRHGEELVEFEKGTNSTWTLKGLAATEEFDDSKTYTLASALAALDFSSVVDPQLTEAELGFATGYVYTVTYAEGSNAVTRVATIGNVVKGGADRYFKLDGEAWTYTIPSYAAEAMMKSRSDFIKAKESRQPEENP